MALGNGGTVTSKGTVNVLASQPYATGISPPALVLDGGALSVNYGAGSGLINGTLPYAITVTTNGGSFITTGSAYPPPYGDTLTGPLTVNGTLTLNTCRNSAPQADQFTFRGPLAGTGTVVTTVADSYQDCVCRMNFASGTNSFSGRFQITAGTLVTADRALGTNGVVDVYGGGITLTYLGFDATIFRGLGIQVPQNYPPGSQPLVRIQPNGSLYVSVTNNGILALDVTLNGGEINGTFGLQGQNLAGQIANVTNALTGTVTLVADSYVGGAGATGYYNWPANAGSLDIRSRITGNYKLTKHACNSAGLTYLVTLNGPITLSNGSNDFNGLNVTYGTLKIAASGAQGVGPLAVRSGSTLAFDVPVGVRDWTVTNDLAGTGTLLVETGTNRLTLAGGTLNPGTNGTVITTNSTGVLTVSGRFAFAATNGTAATLAIDVARTNGVAGVDYDKLAVTTGDAALAASLTNCALVVRAGVPATQLIGTAPITILSAASADFSAARFGSVTFNGASGRVLYNNGSVQVQFQPSGTAIFFR